MSNEIFVSYSRRDQEFVTRLASDLDAKVSGVWFDQSDIQAGQRWRDQIAQGIRNCKVVVLVLSPDSAASQYVQMEINMALEAGKTIIPVLYRPVKLTGALRDLVSETQYIDLQRGSYDDNFQTLVDGLVAAGAAPQTAGSGKFLRERAKTNWGAVVSKIPGWGCAWNVGWAVFWFLVALVIFFLNASARSSSSKDSPVALILALTFGGGFGGLVGGLLAGLMTMLALRRYAPSISWKHMSPAIRNWVISGPLGIIVSGLATFLLVSFGAIRMGTASRRVDCSKLSLGDCIGNTLGTALGDALGNVIVFIFIIALVFILILMVIWFFTGVFAARLSIKHIRRLEPGITRREAGWVMFGWGIGSLLGAIASLFGIGAIAAILQR